MAMTADEKVAYVQALIGNDERYSSALIEAYLMDAKDAVLRRLYPFGVPETVTEIPSMYDMLQCKLCLRYINRIGAEGEVLHAENGVDRHYDTVNDEDLLMEVTPFCKVYA